MAKHSNLDPQASNFSVLDTSHSQVPGTASSFSFPSEPPDIRNWFSSYVYESPEFNKGDDFEGYSFRGGDCVEEGFDGEENSKEKEENLGEFRKIRNNDELILGEKVAPIGFVKPNNTAEDHNHEDKNASQVLGSSDPLSLSSEPPDITRWFSSYVYESPVLDTSDDFRGPIFTESECERVQCNAENCSKEKGENLTEFRRTTNRDLFGRTTERDLLAADEKTSSNSLVKCNSSDRDNEYDHQCKDIHAVEGNKMSPVNDLPVKMLSEQVLEGKPTRKYDVDSTQKVGKSSSDGQVSVGNKGGSTEADIMLLNTNASLGRNNRKSLTKLIHMRDSVEESPAQAKKHGVLAQASNLDLIEVNGNLVRKPTCGSNDKENYGNICTENGFISTRNHRSTRTNDDNSLKRSTEVQFDRLRNRVTDRSVVEKEAVLKRKPLSETTNFQNTYASEITGKWKCPQKSKPNLGPPLKQLRLEQWVHRV